MNIFLIVITIIIAIVCSAFGVIVIRQHNKSWSNRFFFMASQFASIWIVVNGIFPLVSDSNAEILGRISFTAALLLVESLWLFAFSFPKLKFEFSFATSFRLLFWVFIVPGFILLSWTDNLIMGVLRDTQNNPSLDYGKLYPIFSAIVFISMLAVAIELWVKSRSYRMQYGLQISYFALGYSITGAIIFISNVFVPTITGSSYYSRFGPLAMLVFLSVASYAIVRHRLFGIKYIVVKSLIFLLITIVPYVSFYVVLALQTRLWGDPYASGAYALGIVIALLFTILFLLFKQNVDEFFIRNVSLQEYDKNREIELFVKKAEQELDITKLVDLYFTTVLKNLKPKQAYLLLKYSKKDPQKIFRSYGIDLDEKQETVNKILKHISMLEDVQLLKELDGKEELNHSISKTLKTLKIEMIVPFKNTASGVECILLLAEKSNESAYTSLDIDFLDGIKANINIAFTRSVLFEEVERFSSTLAHEVDLATEKIKLQRDRIASALRRERDMTDIIGHELRTPLTISRNAIKLLKEELAALRILESNEKLSRYMQMADNNILREMRLLETMLSSTKIENHRLQLRLEKVDLNSAIDDAILGFGDKAKEKKLKVEVNRTPNVNAYADKVRLQEVVDNLFDNAIKYTPAGTITLSLHQHKDEVEIDISDTGTGISKKDLKKLGHKFYRVKTYVNEKAEDRSKVIRPGGTGLGLFVVFGLVKAMNGRIEVDSTEGKGTTFKVFLPRFSKKLEVKEIDK